MTSVTVADARQTMRDLTDALRAGAVDVDERRAISPEVTQMLKEAGVFWLLAPKRIGGGEVDPLTFFDVVEQASFADGSVGWLVMIGGCYATFGGMLPSAAAAEIYGAERSITAGAFRPNGTAIEVDGGYRVTGRWPQGSGACHADWFLGGAVIVRDGQPVIGPTGVPAMREFWFPADQTTVIDTWTSTGLRGTASHDYAVDDVYVPAERSCWFMEPPVEDGPLYQMAPIAMFACFISAVCLGIARHALAEYIELSQTKVPVLSDAVLADKPVANTKLGRAKALIESGHAYVRGALAHQWDAVCAGHRPTMAARGAQWLAAAHAGQTALDAMELLYSAGGADSVYATSALDRCLRDVRTAVQHICTQEVNYEVAGRLAAGRLEATMASHGIIDYRNEGLV
jgi:alkylation response protein AidB-like acyl-CoA dehydrogenase